MELRLCLLTSVLILLSPAGILFADNKDRILEQKQELDKIKADVEASERKLDSLKNLQLSLQKQVADADQKLASDQEVIRRLNKQLEALKGDIARTGTQLDERRMHLDHTRRRHLGNIRQFYLAVRRENSALPDYANVELKRNRKIIYLSALAAFESENVAEASQYLSESVEEMQELTGKSKQVSGLKKKKEVSYSLDKSRKSKHEKQLDRLRRKSVDEAERIMTLRMAAEEMERILSRLEEERRQKGPAELGEYAVSVFPGLKGQLRSPFRGKVVVPFGSLVDSITNLRSFSPGIAIQGRAGGMVTLVAPGKVAYTGNLRGYGNFIIINHDDQYYTTYGGLDKIYVTEGQHLPDGADLATAGKDGLVKFELRKGREPLDPVTWIKFESL